jgi:hypothetical protein
MVVAYYFAVLSRYFTRKTEENLESRSHNGGYQFEIRKHASRIKSRACWICEIMNEGVVT